MTRHGQTDPVVALSPRRPARPCGSSTGMGRIAANNSGKINMSVRQIRSAIGLTGRPCPSIGLAHNPRPNTPKHKSP
jgi:hypothetical protein